MVKRIGLVAVMILALAGCATEPEVRTVYKTVEVPVAPDLPVIVMPDRPQLPIAKVRPDDEPEDTAKAYRLTIEILKGYVVELETMLEPFTVK